MILVLAAIPGPDPARAAEHVEYGCPFEYREGLIWLKVGLRGSTRPLNMLLDTGANVSVVNLPTARKLGLKIGKPVTVGGVDGTTTGYWPQHLPPSTCPMSLPENLLAVDLSELSRGSDCAVDGLLGADFFADHAVRIDFVRHTIIIDSTAPLPGQSREVPLRRDQGSLQVPLSVNNSPTQWVRLDTGCNSALHWVSPDIPSGETTPRVAVALTRLSIPVTKTKVLLGPFAFDDVPTGIHRSKIFAGEAGLLGNGLLDRFKSVTIDLRSHCLVLEP